MNTFHHIFTGSIPHHSRPFISECRKALLSNPLQNRLRRDHKFVVIGRQNESADNLGADLRLERKKDCIDYFGTFNSSDFVILHGAYDRALNWVYGTNNQLARRTCWIIWGADLTEFPTYSFGLKHFLKQLQFKRNLTSLKVVAGIKYDYNQLRGISGTRAGHVHLLYPMPSTTTNQLKQLCTTNNTTSNLVLIGNSAAPSNNHAELFEFVAANTPKFASYIIPLNYAGPEDYIKRTSELAKAKLAGRANILLDHLNPTVFNQLLSTTEAAIFYHDRQQACGTINRLLFLGKKVFLKPGSGAIELYRSLGAHIWTTEELAASPELLLNPIDADTRLSNQRLIEATCSTTALANYLHNIIIALEH